MVRVDWVEVALECCNTRLDVEDEGGWHGGGELNFVCHDGDVVTSCGMAWFVYVVSLFGTYNISKTSIVNIEYLCEIDGGLYRVWRGKGAREPHRGNNARRDRRTDAKRQEMLIEMYEEKIGIDIAVRELAVSHAAATAQGGDKNGTVARIRG